MKKLYEKIYDKILSDIENKIYESNEKLLSILDLKEKYQVSKNTVLKAIELLELDGVIESRPRSGYYVKTSVYPSNMVTDYTKRYFKKSSDFLYDLSPNAVAYDAFPINIAKNTMRDILNYDYSILFNPTEPQGSIELRESISYLLKRIKNIDANPENIVLSAGMEYLYQIIVELLPSNSIFGVENPGYDIIPTLLNARNIPFISIDSINYENGLNTLINSNANVFSTTSMHQFPIGKKLNKSEKNTIISWLNRNKNNYVIEDDYDSEFQFGAENSEPLYNINSNQVIFLGSFSKSIAPSIRLSYMILPDELMKKYKKSLPFMACPIPAIWQKFLTAFLDNHYIRHLNRMTKIYRKRREFMINTLRGSDKVLEITGEKIGLNILVKFNSKKSDMDISNAAEKSGILVFPLSRFLKGKNPDGTYLSMGFGGLSEEKMKTSLSILLDLI